MIARRYLLPLAVALAALALPASAGAYVYWGDFSGAIGRANNDGSEANQSFIPGAEVVAPLAVDSGHLYYTTSEEDEMGGPAVVRTNLDGGEATPLPEGFLFNGNGVGAVDAEHVYYIDSSGIGRAGLSGENPEPEFLAVGGQLGGIAIYSGYIYWTNFNGGFGESIGRASLATKVVDEEFVEFEISEAAGPRSIAVGAAGVFWTMDPAFDGSFDGNIGFVGLGGGTPTLDEIPGANATAASGLALAGPDLYWSNFREGSGASLVRAELQGAGSTIEPFLPTVAGGSIAANSAGPTSPPLTPPTGPPAPPPPPAAPAPPSTSTPPFKLAKLKLNPKAGTASLLVDLPGPGKLVLAGRGLIGAKQTVAKAGSTTLTLKPSAATRATLEKLGKKKVTAKITFTPRGGTPRTASKPVTLKLN